MLSLALSLTLTVSQPQQQSDWLWTIGLGAVGASVAVAMSWNYIMEDKPNQKPKLTIVPPPTYPSDPHEIAPQSPEEEPQFPDIDFDAEPPAAPQAPPIQPAIGLPLRTAPQRDAIALAQLDLPLKSIPGEVDVERIRAIPLEQREAWLTEYLEENQLLYLLKFVKATPIAIVGFERCGKNTLAMTIGALRRIYCPMPMIACSPHANLDNPFPAFFQCAGYSQKADYRAIAAYLKGLREWVEIGNTTPVTTFWDEASSYPDEFEKEDQYLLNGFTRFCMTECAKHKKYQIISASGMTNACLPGAEGTGKERGKGIVTVFRRVDEDGFGDKFPSPEIVIESPTGRVETLFPKWMNAAWLMRLFPEVNQPIDLPSHLAEVCRLEPEIANAPEAPKVIAVEVTSTEPEVREVKASNVVAFPTSHLQTSPLPDTRKLLFNAIKSHLDSGKSMTWIVEEVLKMKGRKFAEGKQLVEQLIQEFGGDEAS